MWKGCHVSFLVMSRDMISAYQIRGYQPLKITWAPIPRFPFTCGLTYLHTRMYYVPCMDICISKHRCGCLCKIYELPTFFLSLIHEYIEQAHENGYH